MAVFVDPMLSCVPTPRWRWTSACHMAADTEAELHEFAARLGLRREWFQVGRSGLRHYDLTEDKRAQAVRMGAVQISCAAMIALRDRQRTAEAMEKATGSLFGDGGYR